MTKLHTLHPVLGNVITNIEAVIIGKRKIVTFTLVAMLAEGHVLLEDVPGVGKTMLVRSLAASINADFKRIQFTPDLLPSDVTGVSIYNPKEQEFEFKAGPIMGSIILADEINRTSPKTQAALLEAMEEGNITIDGVTMPLPKPFFVMATQNPIDYEGTYPLPEAQLDRFLLKLQMGYPSLEEELEVLNRAQKARPITQLTSVITAEELQQLQEQVRNTYVDEAMKRYMLQIVGATRQHHFVHLGASPRGSIALMKACQAYAFLQGRAFVIPDDVQALAPLVLAHRLILKPEARFEEITAETVIFDIIASAPVPI